MRIFRHLLLLLIFSFVLLSPVSADPTPASGSNTMIGFGQPYSKKEFPGWMLDLRRGETIFFGSLPIFFLFSGLGYDYYYYYGVSGQNPSYAPWPMGPGTSQWTTATNANQLSDKTKTLLLASATASLFLAVVDWAIGKWSQ
jgi:hypothetical protein